MGEYSATAEHAVDFEHAAIDPPPVHQRAFPGRTDQVREARRFLAGILADRPAGLARECPAADNAVVCLSELAANAAIHSRSARPGGQFTVRAQIGLDGRLRVEVSDEGGPWTWPEPDDHSHGRGFVIVASLAKVWGHEGSAADGWMVWYELDCPG